MDLAAARRKRQLVILGDYLLVVAGSVLVGLCVNLFLVPNNVVSGGVAGIAILANHWLGIPVGLGNLVLNVPLLALGWRFGGGRTFFVRTVVSVVAMSAAIDLSAPYVAPPTSDRLLVICYGGILDGLGMALVFRGRGTTGGTDILAVLARKWFGWPIGMSLLAINIAIFAAATFQFGFEPVMVALALAFVASKTLDVVQEGPASGRAALIITAETDAVRAAILEQLGRGCTLLPATGGYTGSERTLLYVVVGAAEVTALKRLLAQVDRKAFVAIAPASEVLGEGFSPNRIE